MNYITGKRAVLLLAAGLALQGAATAEERRIDTAKSHITVHVYKTGVFSALGHDHVIAAPIANGSVDTSAHKVELRVVASSLRVRDTSGSEKDHAQIQETMLGPEVLDAERYHEIVFRSTRVEQAGAGSWTVTGSLTLHGETQPVTVQVRESDGRYTGSARIRQTQFGMKPVKVAGGTVRVKDEVSLEFDIQLAR